MGLNNIHLTASITADLYKNHLIENKPVAAAALGSAGPKDIRHLGENKKKICLLVNYENNVHLPDPALHFLTAILQACKMTLADVAIVNCRQQPVSFAAIRKQFACTDLLLFGVDASGIDLDPLPPFKIVTVNNCNILYSPSVEQLNNDHAESKLLKGKLWVCLKQLFSV